MKKARRARLARLTGVTRMIWNHTGSGLQIQDLNETYAAAILNPET